MELSDLIQENQARRFADLERRNKVAKGPTGDFEGTVTGYWVKIDDNAGGVVEYSGKEYTTKILGWTSIAVGAPVQLTSANGIYYSNW